MLDRTNFYINGRWVAPVNPEQLPVVDPSNGEAFALISQGSPVDVDVAVSAARGAFDAWSATSLRERIGLLERLAALYEERLDDLAQAISSEMGAPITLAREYQATIGLAHIRNFIRELRNYPFERVIYMDAGDHRVLSEPIGVCGLITPWNWPLDALALKVIPALGVGCTMVIKPSEIAPLSSMLFTELVDQAGFPAGVFNLVNGTGPVVGAAIAEHPDIDMVSFTGSTRAGVAVATAAARDVKRATLELGGKSPNILFEDCDLEAAVRRGVASCFENSGQSCNAPTRMLVERSIYERAISLARTAAIETAVDHPSKSGWHIGPVASADQYDKIQRLINAGISEGARLVVGGPGKPDGFEKGYYVRPTIFADVSTRMTIAREEIFGPVLVMTPFDSEDEAIRIANDTEYGLSAYIQSSDAEKLRRVAKRIRAGIVRFNGAASSGGSPFGGYKKSGSGREKGQWGLEAYLELKAVSGTA